MKLNIKSLSMGNFKNHKSLSVEFDPLMEITGRNGSGKSSIADAITWVLFGTDAMGEKLDPSPIGSDVSPMVEMLVNIDGKDILLCRSIEKGTKCFINEVPKAVKEYEEFIGSLFDKSLFLSLFNPSYFPTEHWTKQREILLRYIPEPLNAEVLAKMTPLAQQELGDELKKRELDDIEKVFREKSKQFDKDEISLRARADAYRDQTKEIEERLKGEDLTKLKERFNYLDALIVDISKREKGRRDAIQRRANIEGQLTYTKNQIARDRVKYDDLKANIDVFTSSNCPTCGQAIANNPDAIKEHRLAELETLKQDILNAGDQYKELEKRLAAITVEPFDGSNEEAIKERIEVDRKIDAFREIGYLNEKISLEADDFNKKYSGPRPDRMVEHVKAFRAKKAENMAEKLGGMFQSITIKLEHEHKNGNVEPTFEVEADGIPYAKLSTGQKIRAGLELIDVLSEQSGISVPVFLDNAESLSGAVFEVLNVQAIVCIVLDEELQIKEVLSV